MQIEDFDPNGPADEVVAAILNCAVDELNENTSIVSHAKWDSFAQLEIMSWLADRFGIEITDETIRHYGYLKHIRELEQK